jgi:hypothetical protein
MAYTPCVNNLIRFLLVLLMLAPVGAAGAGEKGALNAASLGMAGQAASEGTTAAVGDASPQFDLDQLIERLKKSEAIGFLTKLAIRSDVLDFRDRIERYRQQKRLPKLLPELRDRFNGLLLKIMALLEDDPGLAHAIYTAREEIWKSLLEVKT